MSEGWDWVRTQTEVCPQCGFHAAGVPTVDLPAAVMDEARRWHEWFGVVLEHPGGLDLLATRTRPERWSALEYACHARDLLGVFGARLVAMINTDDPDLEWWDQDAACRDDHYGSQHPGAVADDLLVAAGDFAQRVARVRGDAWDRTGLRRHTEQFTVAGAVRFVVHELHHHRLDAQAQVLPAG